jgi:hypothetical protein
MRHEGSMRAKRPLVVVVCSILRVERRVRRTCGPMVRCVARVVVKVVAGDSEEATALAGPIVVAAVSSAAFSIVATFTGMGSAELCKIANALVVGALAAAAATTLLRRRMRSGERLDVRPLLAAAARTLLADHGSLPAARVLRVVLGPPRTKAQASVGVALAALAPPLDSPPQGTLLRLALRPASRMLPVMGVALNMHDAYRDSRDSARFVRDFALAAASLCPSPAPLPALCA